MIRKYIIVYVCKSTVYSPNNSQKFVRYKLLRKIKKYAIIEYEKTDKIACAAHTQ